MDKKLPIIKKTCVSCRNFFWTTNKRVTHCTRWCSRSNSKIVDCLICGKAFKAYECRVKRGAGKYCSYRCMGDARKGKPSYVRTPEHRAAMSKIVRARDLSAQGERIKQLNAGKKGKTIEELYPDKAERLREFRKAQVGEKNPNWRGGKHRNRYPYIFYTLRQRILERDGYICQNCDMTQTEAQTKDRLNRGLTIHHIDYNKENNALTNLITLCKWCNSSANSRREEWQIHYSRLLLGV